LHRGDHGCVNLCAVTEGSRKAILAAFFANLGIAIAKLVGFVITRSAGMLAEAIHSFADTGNQALLFVGGSRAKKHATPTMGGLFALYEGISKYRHPHETDSLGVAVGILVFAIGLETFSLRTAVKEANHVRPKGVSWWKFIRTAKQPELPVVLLEDMGAELGLVAALSGVLLTQATDDPRWDAVGSITIGVLLIIIAIILIIEMKGLLIGESASQTDQDAIVAALEGGPGVKSLIHLKTQHIGPDEILVAAKLEYDPTMNIDDLSLAINETEARVRSAVHAARVIYIEPDIRRAPTT
jgi:divalent metal cation (Fe/Co/Zn/Cd) transporter